MDQETLRFAYLIMQLARELNWEGLSQTLLDEDYSKEEICKRWRDMARAVDAPGTSPSLKDFDE